jgi:hypothetical protein
MMPKRKNGIKSGRSNMADENEEFEFRMRAEKESAGAAAPKKTPLQQLQELEPASISAHVVGQQPRSDAVSTPELGDIASAAGRLWDESKLEGLMPEFAGVGAAPKAVSAIPKVEEVAAAVSRTAPKVKVLAPEVAQKQRVLQEAVKEGYVAPPKDIPGAGIATKLAGSLSGKIKTEQAASRIGADVTQRLMKADVGVPQDAVLSEATLDKARFEAGKAYNAIKRIGTPMKSDTKYYDDLKGIRGISASLAEKYPNIGKNPEIEKIAGDLRKAEHDPEHAIELTKILRRDGSKNILSDDPKVFALGQAQKKGAKAIEDLVERNLQSTGKQDLLDNFRAARTRIAKTYDIQGALKPNGYVDLNKLAKKSEKLTGGMKTAAEFAAHFPKSTQDISKLGGEENLGVLDLMLGIGGGLAHPALGAAALARPVARKTILSGPVQRSLADLPMFQK